MRGCGVPLGLVLRGPGCSVINSLDISEPAEAPRRLGEGLPSVERRFESRFSLSGMGLLRRGLSCKVETLRTGARQASRFAGRTRHQDVLRDDHSGS